MARPSTRKRPPSSRRCPPAGGGDDGAAEAVVAAGRAAEAAGAAAAAAGSRLSSLSKPKHAVTTKARSNPRAIREAALAKKLAKYQDPAGTSRTRTTVTKTRSTPGGGEETTTVEMEKTGDAVFKPRYNKKQTMHPEDVYKMRKMEQFIPKKPDKPCPKFDTKKKYEPAEIQLMKDWEKYRDYEEECKAWKKGTPFMSTQEKADKKFERWLAKEEEMHERAWKAGTSQIKPFHLRETERKTPKKTGLGVTASARKRMLPPTPGGKKRYELQDPQGNYIRYNSLNVPCPEDQYNAAGEVPPEYVTPPLNPDGTFIHPKKRTEEEHEQMCRYRRWEEYYHKMQAWEEDRMYEGDPFIAELMKPEKASRRTPGGGGSSAQASALERAAARSNRKAAAEERRLAKLLQEQKDSERRQRALGLTVRSGAAKRAMASAAKREAEAREAELAKIAEDSARKRSFLKRQSTTPQPLRRKLDYSKVQSRIGSMIKQQREAAVAEAEAPCEPICEPEPVAGPSGEPCYEGPAPPGLSYEGYQNMIATESGRARSRRMASQRMEQARRHRYVTGVAPYSAVKFYHEEPVPRPSGPDVQILSYDPSKPVASLFGGPRAPCEAEEEAGMVTPPRCVEPDVPIPFFGLTPRKSWGSPPSSALHGKTLGQPRRYEERAIQAMDKGCDILGYHEMEDPDQVYQPQRVAERYMQQALLDRQAQIAAAYEIQQREGNFAHPSFVDVESHVRASHRPAIEFMQREIEAMQRPESPLPRVRRIRYRSPCTPPITPPPEVPCGNLVDLCEPPPQQCEPSPQQCEPSPESESESEEESYPELCQMPDRYRPGAVNPFLEAARAAIADPLACIPSRADEIAEQAARTERASCPRQPDLLAYHERDQFQRGLSAIDELEAGLEDIELTPPEPWRFPEYRRYIGPQYAVLEQEHMLRPQIHGPWNDPMCGYELPVPQPQPPFPFDLPSSPQQMLPDPIIPMGPPPTLRHQTCPSPLTTPPFRCGFDPCGHTPR